MIKHIKQNYPPSNQLGRHTANSFRRNFWKALLQATISWYIFDSIYLPEPLLSLLLPLAWSRNASLTSERTALRSVTTWVRNTQHLHKEKPICTSQWAGETKLLSECRKHGKLGELHRQLQEETLIYFFWTRCFGKDHTPLHVDVFSTRSTCLLVCAPRMGCYNRFKAILTI